MAYLELEDMRGYLDIDATGDNPLLQEAIKDAEAYINSQTNRRFESLTATRYYLEDAIDPQDSTLLHLDSDLLTVTLLSNGDMAGTTSYTPDHTTERLTLGSASVYARLETGTRVTVRSTTYDPPAPLSRDATYHVILVASPVIQLASSYANAVAGTAIALTDNGTGTHYITCGGAIIPPSEYWRYPRNQGPPYWGIKLKADTGYGWEFDPDGWASITGTWGYATTVPHDIRRATAVLAAYFFRQKDAQMFETTAIVESGAIAIPQGIPATVDRIIKRYRRMI